MQAGKGPEYTGSICSHGLWKTGMDCSRVHERNAQGGGEREARAAASQDTAQDRKPGVSVPHWVLSRTHEHLWGKDSQGTVSECSPRARSVL